MMSWGRDLAVLNLIGKRHEPRFLVTPERYGGFADDGPDHSVARSRSAVDRGRLRPAAGMRGEIAGESRTAATRLSVCIDERLGIDLEAATSVIGHVGRSERIRDRAVIAEQNAAAFLGRSPFGFRPHAIHCRS